MSTTISCTACNGSLRIREEHAGKKIKCPKCGAIIQVPFASGGPEEGLLEAFPVSGAPPAYVHQKDPIPVLPAHPRTPAPTRPCPDCGELVALRAKRCPECGAWMDDEEYDEEEESPYVRRPRVPYKPCPKCAGQDAERVTWTPWGSFYGPAIFTHVRCQICGYGYNGRTGRSNLIPAIIFVTVPAILILIIVGFIIFMLMSPMMVRR